MKKTKTALKRLLSALLVVVMLISSAPLSGFVGLSLPEWLTVKSKAADSSDFSETFTDGIKFMDSTMANSFIGFIYNVRTDLVSDDMRSMGDIYNYLTGGFSKGSDEYFCAQFSFLVTSEYFINKQVSIQSSYASQATENLINYLQKKIGNNDDGGAQALVNSELGKVKSHVKKILYYALELDDNDIYQNIEMILSSYEKISGVVDKAKKFVEAIDTAINTYYLAYSTNAVKAYNYYNTYLNNRGVGTEDGILELIMEAYVLGNVSILDGIPIFLQQLGYGNSWTNEDVQKVLRTFAEFTYHSRVEHSALNGGGDSGSTEVHNHTMEFSYETDYSAVFACTSCGEEYSTPKCKYEVNGDIIEALYGYSVLKYCTYIKLESSEHFPYRNVAAGAFSDTKNGYLDKIDTIIIPEGYTTLGYNAFSGCKNVKNIYLPSTIKDIGLNAFADTSSVMNVYYGGTLKQWLSLDRSEAVFSDFNLYINGKAVGDIVIPDDFTEINEYVFCNCKNLTSVTMSNSVTSIGASAFSGCTGLTSVLISNSITNIDHFVFYRCIGLVSITIPNSVTSIGSFAFSRCSGLTSITIPHDVINIGYESFRGCTGLTNITISNSVKRIGYYAFEDCTGLISVNYTGTIEDWCKIEFANRYSNPTHYSKRLYINGELIDGVVILDTITEIKKCVFYNCENITSITIPNSVSSIGDYAFYGCTGLTSITIPDNVTNIGNYAFSNCTGLTDTYYTGSDTQWSEIDIGLTNDALTSSRIHYDVAAFGEIAFGKSSTVDVAAGKQVIYKFVPETSGTYYFGSSSNGNVYKYLYDSEYNVLASNLNGGKISYSFEAGKTYYLSANFGSSTANGDITVSLFDEVNYVSKLPGSNTVIDNDKNLVHGFSAGLTSSTIGDFIAVSDGYSTKLTSAKGSKVGTGSILSVSDNNGNVIDSYTVVIFGDTDGDGWYDGQDAVMVSMLASGMLTREQVGEAVYMAADCNHDGVIDQADVDLLNQAGALLSNVDQTLSTEEMLETAAYKEYSELIDQTPTIDEAEDNTAEETPTEETPTANNLWATLLAYLEKILSFIISLFKIA